MQYARFQVLGEQQYPQLVERGPDCLNLLEHV